MASVKLVIAGLHLIVIKAPYQSSPSLARNISCGGIIGVCIVVSEVYQ